MPELNSDIAYSAPNLYAAAKKSNLNAAQINQVNQIAGTVALNKQLSSLPVKDAQQQWNQLDPHIQEQVRAMYGEAAYIPRPSGWQAPTSVGAVAADLGKVGLGAFRTVITPFRAAFSAAGAYNRAINAPYLLYREVSQGANPFSWSTWKNAVDGRSVFDQKAIKPLVEEYGPTDAFVVTKTLAGYKPGEIIDAYGKVDNLIIDSINKMYNEPDKFNEMLRRFKAAQVSPGRDIMRVFFNTARYDNPMERNLWTYSTGLLDAAYQMVVDPLTWITGGTTKLLTKGEKLADLYFKAADTDKAKTIANIFKDPDVFNTWNRFGPVVKELHDARAAGSVKTTGIMDRIKYEFPQFNDSSLLHLLVEGKVFDVQSAERFANTGQNMIQLINGRLDGTTFFRNAVPLAKAGRHRISGFNIALSNFFNGVASGLEEAGLKEIEAVGKLADPTIDRAATQNLDKMRSEMDSIGRKLGRLVSRFPGSNEIKWRDYNVHETLGTVNALARVVYPKTFANMFTEHFIQASEPDRVILIRGLYVQIMEAMGLRGAEGGNDFIKNVLQEKFADSTTYASARRLDIPAHFEKNIESVKIPFDQPDSSMTGLLSMEHAGQLHNYNATDAIGNLPWASKHGEPSLADYTLRKDDAGRVRKFMDMIGGSTRSKFIRGTVNSWSVATLVPRLGIRSSIDEFFFYSMMAPAQDLYKFAMGEGYKLNRAMIAFSGNRKSIPPISRIIQDWLDKNPASFVELEKRFVKDGTINGVEALRLSKKTDIINEVKKIIEDKNFIPEELRPLMYQAMRHNPNIVSSMVNSIIGKSALEAGLDTGDLVGIILSNSQLTNMFRQLGFTPTGTYKSYSEAELASKNEKAIAAAHFENWFMRFTKNTRKFGESTMNPGVTFVHFNGLRTEQDVAAAKATLLHQIGIGENGRIIDPKALDEFLNMSQYSSRDKADGLTPVESATHRIEAMLVDMYRVFHGDANSFNDRLFGFIRDLAEQYKTKGIPYVNAAGEEKFRKVGASQAIEEAMNAIPFDSFDELTKGHRLQGEINTMLNFSPEATNEGFYAKLLEWEAKGMDWMDAQNNHLFRQPALWFTYTKFRERYKNDEIKFVNDQVAMGMERQFATELAEKRFTEIAMNNAALNVLKFVDNPQIRSNLAWTLRTTGRFYRATEDFYRRVWRLKDLTPQVIYRMRLAHLGLDAAGFIHKDQNGEPYMIMPADNIIFHALNGTMSLLGANIKQPLFNDFTMKLTMANPSFQQDAGQPSLSGPFAAFPVFVAQNVLNKWGGDLGKRIASELDNVALGNMNQNLTWTKVFVPTGVKRVYDMIPKGEWDQQEASAFMQAIAYNAAHGLFLSPEQFNKLSPQDQAYYKNAYLKQIKITAHNVVFMRAFLGLISPVSPSIQESKDVPNYLKDNGITTLRGEFNDIAQSIKRNAAGVIHDPYEAALMTFIGKNPGKLVYTVSRNDKNVSVLVNNSKEMQNWVLSNGNAVDKYGDAALIFAPHIGKYNADVYTWMQAAGMSSHRKIADYFDEVAVAQDRQLYFDYKKAAELALEDPSLNTYQRQGILNELSARQNALKQANPLLDIALQNSLFGIGKQLQMLNNLDTLVNYNIVDMTDATRNKMQTAVNVVRNAIAQLKTTPPSNAINWTEMKQQIKADTMAALHELGGSDVRGSIQDPVLAEANRAIFQPILDFYVRDNLKASF